MKTAFKSVWLSVPTLILLGACHLVAAQSSPNPAVIETLPALSTAVEQALVVHRRAHGNGRGNAYPTLPTA